MSKVILTICIPTYNRAHFLERSLRNILPQIFPHNGAVCVHVSDNCSQDDTTAVVSEFRKQYGDVLSYKRQHENLGWERNFVDSLQTVSSRYAVLMGDDDYVLPHYVETVLRTLAADEKLGVVFYNALQVGEREELLGFLDKRFPSSSLTTYECGGDFIKAHLDGPSLMSATVFDRELFLNKAQDMAIGRYPGYDWFAALCRVALDSRCAYLREPIFVNFNPSDRPWLGDAAWYTMFGLGRLFSDLDKCAPGVYQSWMRQFDCKGFPRHILELVGRYPDRYRERIKDMSAYAPSAYYGVWLWLAVRIPGAVVVRMFERYHEIKSRVRSVFKR